MLDPQKLNIKKERIISFVRMRGPSLPVHISKDIAEDSLFTSAFLSEMYNERKLKMSNLKVGSSYLYFLPGQEDKLENFVQYLNSREREAFELLKKEGVLEEEKQTPIIRVALKAIKDFAIPVQIKSDENERIFWKFYSLGEEEFKEKVREITHDKWKDEEMKKKELEESERKLKEKKEGVRGFVGIKEQEKTSEKLAGRTVEGKKEVEQETKEIFKEAKAEISGQEVKEKPRAARAKRKAAKIDTKFADMVKEHLTARDVEVLGDILIKKKEYLARVRIDEKFGKQEYYLVAKDKKKICEEDLLVALQKAQALKMPALVLAKGNLNKEAEESIKEWKNFVKFEKIKL